MMIWIMQEEWEKRKGHSERASQVGDRTISGNNASCISIALDSSSLYDARTRT